MLCYRVFVRPSSDPIISELHRIATSKLLVDSWKGNIMKTFTFEGKTHMFAEEVNQRKTVLYTATLTTITTYVVKCGS